MVFSALDEIVKEANAYKVGARGVRARPVSFVLYARTIKSGQDIYRVHIPSLSPLFRAFPLLTITPLPGGDHRPGVHDRVRLPRAGRGPRVEAGDARARDPRLRGQPVCQRRARAPQNGHPLRKRESLSLLCISRSSKKNKWASQKSNFAFQNFLLALGWLTRHSPASHIDCELIPGSVGGTG